MINAFTEIELAKLPHDKILSLVEQNKEEIIDVNSVSLNDYFIVIYTKKSSIEITSLGINPNKEEEIKSKLIKECFKQKIVDRINIGKNDKEKNTFEIIVFTLTFVFVINVDVENFNYSVKKSAEIQYEGILTCIYKIKDDNYTFILGLNNGNIIKANIDTTKQDLLECNLNKVELIEPQYSLLSYFNPFSYFQKPEPKAKEIIGINSIFYIETHDLICCLKEDMNIDFLSLKNKKLICTHSYLKEKISQSKLHRLLYYVPETKNNKTETNLLIITSFNDNNSGSLFCFSCELNSSKIKTLTEYLYPCQIKDIMFYNNAKLFIALVNGDIIIYDKYLMHKQLYIYTYEHKYMELQSKQTKDVSDILSSNYYFREKSILNVMKTKYSKVFSNISTAKNYISISHSVNYTDIINNLISQEISENTIISFGILNNNTVCLIRDQTISILHKMDSNERNLISCSISKMKYYSHQLSILFKDEKNLEQNIKSLIKKETLDLDNQDNTFFYIILALMYIMFDYKENKNVFVSDLEFIHEIIYECCSQHIDKIIECIIEIIDNLTILFEDNKIAQNSNSNLNQDNNFHELSIYVKVISKIIITHIEDLIMLTKSICIFIKWLMEYSMNDNDSLHKKMKIEDILQQMDIYYRYYLTAKLISDKQYIPIILLENITNKSLDSYFIDNDRNIDFIIHQLIYSTNININLFKTLFLNKEYILISKCNSLINPNNIILCINYFELIIQLLNPKRVHILRNIMTFLFFNLPYTLDENTPKLIKDDINNIDIINKEILGLDIQMETNLFTWIYKCINNYVSQTLNPEIKLHFYSFCASYILPFEIHNEDTAKKIIESLFNFVIHLSSDKIQMFIENIKNCYPKYYPLILDQIKQNLEKGDNLQINYKIIDSLSFSYAIFTKNANISFLNEFITKIEQSKDYLSQIENLLLLRQIYLNMEKYLKVIELSLIILQHNYNNVDTLQQRKN